MPELGAAEVLVIAIVALLLFGPDRIPEMAKNLGKGMRELQRWKGDLRKEFESLVDLDIPDLAPKIEAPLQTGRAAETPASTAGGSERELDRPRPVDPYA